MPQNSFTLEAMTAAINDADAVPSRLQQLGLYQEEGVETTSVRIDKQGESIILVPSKERGAPGTALANDKRTSVTMGLIHLPVSGGLSADAVQNVKAFGSTTELEQIETRRDRELRRMRNSLEATHEWQRLGGINGKILDADGTEIYNLFSLFNMTKNSLQIDFAAKDLSTQLNPAKRVSEKAMKNRRPRRWRVLAGPELMDSMLRHDDFKRAYDRYMESAPLRDGVQGGISFGGALWEEFTAEVGSTNFMAPEEGRLIPEGVGDLFIARFGPADYEDTVNTTGLPFYAAAEPRAFNKGWDFEGQSNSLFVCTCPRAVGHLSIKPAA